MHPILTNRLRTLIYVASWVPIAGLLAAILARSGSMPAIEAALIVFPLCFLYAFICQASWYLCRALPLHETEILRLIGTHGVAAVLSCLVWLLVGYLWALALYSTGSFAGITGRYLAQMAVLFFSGILLFLLAVALNYLLITIEVSQRAEKKALESQALAREAELKALRAQIDPHFLFNSLNSINALIGADPVAARQMCVLLGEFLRGCLKLGAKDWISLGQEIQLAQNYLDIEKVRLGARLSVESNIDAHCENCLVPPLILQPLVENAITHGVAPLLDGGTIRIEAARHGPGIRVIIENPFEMDDVRAASGAGLGIQNVRMRLKNLFNGDARLDAIQNGSLFRVEMQMPCSGS